MLDSNVTQDEVDSYGLEKKWEVSSTLNPYIPENAHHTIGRAKVLF